MNRFFLILIGSILIFQVIADERSVHNKYDNLIQTIECPSDQAKYGNSYDYGYWAGGLWCDKDGKAGYWVWVAPTWFIWKNKNYGQTQNSNAQNNNTESKTNRQTQTSSSQNINIESKINRQTQVSTPQNKNIEFLINQVDKIRTSTSKKDISSFFNALFGNENQEPKAISEPDNSTLLLNSNNSTNNNANKPEITSNPPSINYSTSRGNVVPLIDDNKKFIGTYNNALNGYIHLKNKDDAFVGYWAQNHSKFKCDTTKIGRNGTITYFWGRLIVHETESGPFGLWSHCNDSPDNKWDLLNSNYSTSRGNVVPLIDDNKKFIGTYNNVLNGYIHLKNKDDAFVGYWAQNHSKFKCDTTKVGRNGTITYFWGRLIVHETESGAFGLWSHCNESPDKKWVLL